MVRVAKQFGVGYMQYMVMQELKLVEKHAKAAGLDITTEWATFRSSDVMNDALISGSVDFVSRSAFPASSRSIPRPKAAPTR